MDIQSIELSHESPSLGPYSQKTSYTIEAKDFPEELSKLLDETRINGVVSLREYLDILKASDAARNQAVVDAFKPEPLAEGATISSLRFQLADGALLELSDLRRFKIEGYYATAFVRILVDRGSKFVSEPPADVSRVTTSRPTSSAETSDETAVRPAKTPQPR